VLHVVTVKISFLLSKKICSKLMIRHACLAEGGRIRQLEREGAEQPFTGPPQSRGSATTKSQHPTRPKLHRGSSGPV